MQSEIASPNVLQRLPTENGLAVIRLDKSKSLNVLDTELCRELSETIHQLTQDGSVKAIWLDATSTKAFCAGGDVRILRQHVLAGEPEAVDTFFKTEYALDWQIRKLKKPLIIWGEGIVMGGGMGLFTAAAFRILTPASRLAMPEVTIGLYPDVGSSRYLKSLGQLGLLLGMSGAITNAAQAMSLGWGNCYTEQARESVLARLLDINWLDWDSPFNAVANTLQTVSTPSWTFTSIWPDEMKQALPHGENFQADYQQVVRLAESADPWLAQAGNNVKHGSLLSAAVSWLAWQWFHQQSWQSVYALEQQLSGQMIRQPDFSEGVRALLIDKDRQPKWQICHFEQLRPVLISLSDDQVWKQLVEQHFPA